MGASKQRFQAIALLSAVIAAGCGGGGDSSPAPAPAPAPVQTPAPPPPPPPAPALAIGVMVNGVAATPSGGSYAVAPGQTVNLTANKAVTWTPSAANVTLRSTTSGSTQWSSQVLNPAAIQGAFSITATAGGEAVPVSFVLAPGDGRNGRYVMFGTDMVRYAITVDFDTSEYSIVTDSAAPGTPVASGAFTTNPGNAGEYVFNVVVGAGMSNTARFRAANDLLVGNYPFPGTASAVSFIAARRFATSAADFPSNTDFQIFSREEVAGSTPNTSLFTLRINGSVLTSCVHPGITVIESCPVPLFVSDLTFNADGSIRSVARAPSTDEAIVHVARSGNDWVYLRSSPTPSGLARFRIGLALQPALGATATIGDTRGNYGLVTVTGADVTFAGDGPAGATSFGIGSFPVLTFGPGWPSGLFIYSETGVDQYFIGQSPRLVVINGARNLSNPFVNGYIAVGLRP